MDGPGPPVDEDKVVGAEETELEILAAGSEADRSDVKIDMHDPLGNEIGTIYQDPCCVDGCGDLRDEIRVSRSCDPGLTG